ncbi:hypothetical protein [Thermomonospora cellulosilytica]|uniref:Integral membrane protein n=1 Tax=Thermomonospora cellulosilytica TaxID=1411118 RepID=A0A7W3N4Y0_9ACTN|nr:hypothetical protein [Thermomonospora cellulosilytica]MBA9007548.1 hypothetical protein [Thermomonospora cellulosilytica]
MEVLRVVLLAGHLAALAVLLVSVVVHLGAGRRIGAVLPAAAGALLGTGVLLAAVRTAGDMGNNEPKLAVKLAVAVAVFVCALLARRRPDGAHAAASRNDRPTGPLPYAVAVLTIANAAIAVAWT